MKKLENILMPILGFMFDYWPVALLTLMLGFFGLLLIAYANAG